jgi:hypothetical protein
MPATPGWALRVILELYLDFKVVSAHFRPDNTRIILGFQSRLDASPGGGAPNLLKNAHGKLLLKENCVNRGGAAPEEVGVWLSGV